MAAWDRLFVADGLGACSTWIGLRQASHTALEAVFEVLQGSTGRMLAITKRSHRVLITKCKTLAIKASFARRSGERSVIVLTSSPRSGSTWLGNALGSIRNSCVLFEPLQLTHVPESKAAGFSWRTFVHPENRWPEGEAYLRRVFEGRVVNDWTSREMSLREASRSTTLIVKFVRANRLLPWICQTFKLRLSILLIRHPCAVIASQLNSPNWRTAERPDAPSYIARYPLFKSALSKTEGVEENLAASWALDQLPPLMEETPHPWMIVTYEELWLRPEITLAKIFQACNLEVDVDTAISRLEKPSRVVYKSGISGINGWKKQLSGNQVSRILNTIEGFGLSFYNQHVEPDLDALNNELLPMHIRKAGTG